MTTQVPSIRSRMSKSMAEIAGFVPLSEPKQDKATILEAAVVYLEYFYKNVLNIDQFHREFTNALQSNSTGIALDGTKQELLIVITASQLPQAKKSQRTAPGGEVPKKRPATASASARKRPAHSDPVSFSIPISRSASGSSEVKSSLDQATNVEETVSDPSPMFVEAQLPRKMSAPIFIPKEINVDDWDNSEDQVVPNDRTTPQPKVKQNATRFEDNTSMEEEDREVPRYRQEDDEDSNDGGIPRLIIDETNIPKNSILGREHF